jgi:transposase
MDAGHQLLDDLREGRLDAERWLDVIGSLQRQLQATQQRLEAAQQRIAELEKQAGVPATAKLAEPFSVQAEEKRQQARHRKKKKRPGRRGRRPTDDKLKQAECSERCFPEGVPEQDCHLSHTRPVWRLEAGRAVLVAYQIYRGPHKQYGQIPGVLGRSEFGLELVVEIAYLVYVVGLSFDKVRGLLRFMQQVELGKTQIDRLLRQLAQHWQPEFDTLCTLLANSLVVHADETRWSINSVWAFLSEKARLLFFGVAKDADTLAQILDPASFAGLMISDDAAVYANFSQAQKCWAHLLRKAIYRQACRAQRDRRLGDAGRAGRVAALEDALLDLCAPRWDAESPPLADGPANDFRLLVNEVMRLALHEQLFTFRDDRPGRSAQRHERTGVWHQQRSGAHVARRGRGAQDRADQQDARGSPAANHPGQRAGIVARVPADVHPGQRDGRNHFLVASGPKLLPQAAQPHGTEGAGRIGSRQGLAPCR